MVNDPLMIDFRYCKIFLLFRTENISRCHFDFIQPLLKSRKKVCFVCFHSPQLSQLSTSHQFSQMSKNIINHGNGQQQQFLALGYLRFLADSIFDSFRCHRAAQHGHKSLNLTMNGPNVSVRQLLTPLLLYSQHRESRAKIVDIVV